MSLPVPLSVRLSTSRADRIVTREVRDLQFRSIAPGGFASATIDLDRPLSLQPDEIGYYGKLVVYDARNGSTVWEGRLEDPGRGAGGDGQVWHLAAVGGSAHTQDRTVPLIYVDRDLTKWTAVEVAACPDGQVRVGDDQTIFPGEPSMTMQMPSGTPVTANTWISRAYLPISRAGQKLARIGFRYDAGRTDANLLIRLYSRIAANWVGSFFLVYEDGARTTGGSVTRVVGTGIPAGLDTADVRLQWVGANATVGDDVTWGAFAGMAIQATRYDKSGTELLTAASYSNDTVLGSDIVADLLGRLLNQYDGPGASIAATSYGIDQLAWPDGISANAVLAELMRLEPAYYWAAWETSPTNGRYRFEWSQWPTSVRYEATAVDGFDSPGSADGLYNAVTVRYKDAAGEIRTVRRTGTVPELTAAALTREGYLDLGDVTGSLANATQAGDRWLEEHRYAPNAGRLTIARPILDLVTSRMVMPWEIRPGHLIRVRGVLPRVDALNATARDGVTTFRIVGTTFRASSASTELELDSYPPTVARALADLHRRPITARR